MAFSRQVSDIYGKMVYFAYDPDVIFLRSQEVSQYHANANKDEKGNLILSTAFSEDHQVYFNQYCRDGLGAIASIFVKVNKRSLQPFAFTENDKAELHISDWGFVKDTLLSVLDPAVEDALVNYILLRWYEHLGDDALKKYFQDEYLRYLITIRDSLYQFLRKQKDNIYSEYWTKAICTQIEGDNAFKQQWSDPVCVQLDSMIFNEKWSDPVCVQIGNMSFTEQWSDPVCVSVSPNQFTEQWSDPICEQTQNLVFTEQWSDAICVQNPIHDFTEQWSDPICVQTTEHQFTEKWSDAVCVQAQEAVFEERWSDAVCIQNNTLLTIK